jgi:hypothetical protein
VDCRAAGRHRPFRGILKRRQKSRVDPPVGRMIAAEFVAELLAQVILGPARARIGRGPIRLDPRTFASRRGLLRGGDEILLAHPRQHDMAAFEGAVVVGPR